MQWTFADDVAGRLGSCACGPAQGNGHHEVVGDPSQPANAEMAPLIMELRNVAMELAVECDALRDRLARLEAAPPPRTRRAARTRHF